MDVDARTKEHSWQVARRQRVPADNGGPAGQPPPNGPLLPAALTLSCRSTRNKETNTAMLYRRTHLSHHRLILHWIEGAGGVD